MKQNLRKLRPQPASRTRDVRGFRGFTPGLTLGFTLVEMLVALFLMALLSLIGWRGLDAIARSNVRLEQHTDDALALLRVMGQIERDISQRAHRDVLAASLEFDGQSLTLARSAGAGVWQIVHWRLERGVLTRATGQAASTLPLPTPAPAGTVLENVSGFTVRAWLPGRGWTAAPLPPAALDAAAPGAMTGLEITLTRAGSKGPHTWRKVVVLS